MPLTKTAKQLVSSATARITSLTPQQAAAKLGAPDVLFVDIRDARELDREGMIPGAFHAPRGMLEFWVDPDSPYYKPVFTEDKLWVLYCQSAWRSALATAALQDMGLTNVAQVAGGFSAWKQADQPMAAREKKD
jgi:2-methylaconitate isomerase